MKTKYRTIKSAVAGYLVLAACCVSGSQAWASLVVEPLNLVQSALNESQGQQTFDRLSVLPQRLETPAASERGKRFSGAPGAAPDAADAPDKSLLQLPFNAQGGAVVAALPVYAADGWGGDSSGSEAGAYSPSHRLSDWQELARANQGLTGGAFKEIVGSSDVKALLDLNVELKKFVDGTVFEAQSPNVADLDPTRRVEIKSTYVDVDRPNGPPPTAAEREMDTLRASVMFWQLVDEVKPWAFSVLLLYWSFLALRGYLRMQARRRGSALKSRSRRHKRQSSRAATLPPAAQ